MKIYTLLTFFLILISPAYAKKHYIFLIHGVGNNSSVFDDFEFILKRRLERVSQKQDFVFDRFQYRTGDDQLDSFDFALSFSKHLTDFFDKNELGLNDELSIVGYSQGGLVGLNWIYSTYKEKEGFSNKFLLNHIDSFITLGTPFWGTEIVRFPIIFNRATKRSFDLPVGEKEIRDMRFGSELIRNYLKIFSGADEKFIHFLQNKVRVLNIVGQSYFGGILAGKDWELGSDTTVPVVSAHPNFYYLKEGKRTKKIEIGNYFLAKAAHISIPFEDGLLDFPEACLFERSCHHEAVSPIFFHLLKIGGLLPRIYSFRKREERSFVLGISLKVDSLEGKISEDDFHFIFLPDRSDQIDINKSPILFRNDKGRDFQFYFSGKFRKKEISEAGIKIYMRSLKIPIQKLFVTKIERGYFSFIEGKL